MTRKALIAGSFDPITNGHIDIIKRTALLFDEVYIGVGVNSVKTYMFSSEKRIQFIKNVFSDYPNVIVLEYTGLLSEFAYSLNIDCIIRGIRNSSDYESEITLQSVNKDIKGIETLFMAASPSFNSVSSSMVKAVVAEYGFVHEYVPLEVKAALEEVILKRRYIAIVGNSCSGKSKFANTLIADGLQHGNSIDSILHIDLDKLAHEIYESNEPYCMACKESMGIYFGREILNDDMTINRAVLAKRVFSNAQDLAVLSELIKKPIRHKFYELVRNSMANTILVDGATIIESGLIAHLNNHCVLLSCNNEIALERIMERDSTSLSNAMDRLNSQTPIEHKSNLLSECIDNAKYGRKIEIDTSDICNIEYDYNDILK
jgi:pantetheine-phosphate adenylyltransferase